MPAYRISSTSELLPLPLTPGDRRERAERDLDVDVLQVVVAGADDFQAGSRSSVRDQGSGELRTSALLPCDFWLLPHRRSPTPSPAIRRFVGTAIAFLPLRYGPVTRAAGLAELVGRARRRRSGRRVAGAGAEVEQVIGGLDHFAVVLDDDQRVAQIAELLQRLEQPRLSRGCRPIVGSSSTYSTPHRPLPIWLASRMRCASPPESVGRRPRQRQIIESDVDQELQAAGDLAQQFAGDLLLRLAQLPAVDLRWPIRPAAACPSSPIVWPRKRTAAASSRKRLPSQVEQSTSPTRCSSLHAQARRRAATLLRWPGRGPCTGNRKSRVSTVDAHCSALDFAPTLSCELSVTSIHCVARAVQNHAADAGRRAARTARRAEAACRGRAPSSIARAIGKLQVGPQIEHAFGQRQLRIAHSAAGLAPICTPRPSQVGHQPSGLLNEKLCGVSGSKLRPHWSQARCWL